MRCRRCQRSISGIGKPAVPPIIPALVAFAGGFGGLWSLTLGQDPSNALPHWSPVSGWVLGLGSLALAAVLTWMGLVRRRCPDCGSWQMFDAMEEEAVNASERLAAQRVAVEEALAESRPLHDKEVTEKLAAREKELQSSLEQELRTRLIRELEPQIERDLRGRLEKELRTTLGNELRSRAEHEQRSVATARANSSTITPGPVTPPLTATARPFASSSAPQVIANAKPPRPAAPTIAAKDVTPAPLRPFSAPHPKVETAPLSLRSSLAKDRGGKP